MIRRLLAAALLVGAAVLVYQRGFIRLPAAERGRRLAERTGCFGCHVHEGSSGAGNPGRVDKTVPSFSGDLMMYVKADSEIVAWIRDGSTASRRNSEQWKAERMKGTLRMPSFRRRFSNAQITDLAAYVSAMGGRPAPADSLAKHGLERMGTLGCEGCHGAGGRLARPNPGSLKGYVPSWDGPDFAELVHGRSEFDEWVKHGISARFDGNVFAKYFLRRAVLHMPAFERHLELGDVDALWAYVTWLRGPHPAGDAPPQEE
jgi:mono/diheme cytochrome c family protein